MMERELVVGVVQVEEFVIQIRLEFCAAFVQGYRMTECLDAGVIFSEGDMSRDDSNGVDGVPICALESHKFVQMSKAPYHTPTNSMSTSIENVFFYDTDSEVVLD